MKRLIILLASVFILGHLPAQDSLLDKDPITTLQTIQDSPRKKEQQEIAKETSGQVNHNLSAFVKMQKERKEKQQVYVRIALGTLFLIVLVVGLTRRKKPA